MRRTIGIILAGALAAPLAAQTAEPLLRTDNRIAADAPRDAAERTYRDETVTLQQGRRYRISAQSDAFDTILQVRRQGSEDALAENDDVDGTLNSRLSFTPSASGAYVLRVLGYGENAAGAYRLTVEELPPLPAPRRASPAATTSYTVAHYDGALGPDDPEENGARLDDFLFTFEAGRETLIGVDAVDESFDPVVHVYAAGATDGEPIASDDDGGSGLNSLLVFTPEQSGDYVVRVTSFGSGGAGAYRLRIGR